ncbi:CBS domain-containing protein [Haloplanus rubicundus]|uniref:CBS domain-containing protein n=1 Tax=Haloplanus rubicundus TaxID=1547898 RepID=A0A345E1N5_9EURY|nr:CBS domain-containing protein [Haloplanus rubicundus]AXG06107.1 CBS domain-containing protein [Haloplanus rubicundus]AXG09451.1 CBS domain-containing protein [Haloplanus rubicundus]
MEDVFVGSLMSSPVHTIGGDATLREAAAVLLDHGIGSVVVVDDAGRLDGILTATDFVTVVADGTGDYDPATSVATAMSTDVVTTTANDTVEAAADLMIESGHYHLPVVDADGAVIGVITSHDLTAYVSTVRTPSPPSRDTA